MSVSSAVSSGHQMVKFESGYTVETVFDGSKLGIEPYSVEISPNGELLVLDSENSNIYKISTPLSQCMLLFVFYFKVWNLHFSKISSRDKTRSMFFSKEIPNSSGQNQILRIY